jgi:hypothetical protein
LLPKMSRIMTEIITEELLNALPNPKWNLSTTLWMSAQIQFAFIL